MTDYDLIAIGSGSAAFASAIRATEHGARVALVERGTVGGACVNVGCIPSKQLLAASDAYHAAGHHPFSGVSTSQGDVDLAALVGAKAAVVEELRSEKYLDLAGDYGFDIIQGEARFAGPGAVAVDGRELAGHLLIATGAAPWIPPIPGLEEAGYLTSTTAMELSDLPASVVVIGGNYIGLELGQMFANLGSNVTVLEARDQIAPFEEPEIAEVLTSTLRAEGIDVVTSVRIDRVEPGTLKRIVGEVAGTERRFEADQVLVATGRRPVLDGLDLQRAGIDVDDRGMLVLDEELRTTNPRVFAAGDVTGAPQYVYVAAAQGTLAADNALTGAARSMEYRALPRVMFTRPSIAAVGLTDEEAQRAGYVCECRVMGLEHVPRGRVSLDTRGLFKVVADRGTGRVLGVHVLAENAGDVILAGVYAVEFGLTVDDLANTWAPYLTMSEGLKLASQAFTRELSRLSC